MGFFGRFLTEAGIMAKVAGILALAVVMACPLVSQGHGLRRSRVAVSYYYPGYAPLVAYYYALPVYVAPPLPVCVPAVQPAPVPLSTAPTTQPPPLAAPYAPPTPAPASGSQASQKSLSSQSAASY